jgi:hypothetical protein
MATYQLATQQDIPKRVQCERRRAALELERATFIAQWRDLADYILPRRLRLVTSDNNRGEKRNQKIIDSTATESAGVLSAGMMSGVTNPSTRWFRLTVADPDLAEQTDVKSWLYDVQSNMETVFIRSNLYNKLPILYQDAGTFGTGAIGVFEDDEHVIRVYDFPVGSYSLGLDGKCRVRIFARAFRYTVQQVVEEWGHYDPKTGRAGFEDGLPTTLSVTVQQAWKLGAREQWVDLVHLIQPNDAYDGITFESKYKRYEEVYYERAGSNIGFLEHSGYDEFPILAARWETAGEDVYGTNCPGMRALGDIKQLQTMEKRVAQAIEKQINPPLKGPSELRSQRVSSLPGDITYTNEREGNAGLQPLYQVTFDLSAAEQKSQQIRQRIQRAYKEDLFLMLAQDDRSGVTAREVDERHEEKMLALGPVLEQLNDDVLDPLIDRVFSIMNRRGLIPQPPEQLQGVPLTVQYISIMAQAQRAVGLASLDRFAGAIGQVAQFIPEVLDRFNADEWTAQYAEGSGVPPTVLRSADDAQQIRDQRAQAQTQNQGVDNLSKIAGAARDLGNSPTQGSGALAQLVAVARAKGTMAAARTPLPGANQ